MCSSQHQPELLHRSQSNFILRISYPTHRDVGQLGSIFICVRPTKKGPGSLTPALSYQHQGCSPLMASGTTRISLSRGAFDRRSGGPLGKET